MRYAVGRIPLKAAAVYLTLLAVLLASYAGVTFWSVTGSLENELDQANMSLLRQMNQKIDMTLREIDKLTLDLVQGEEIYRFVENPDITDAQKLQLFEAVSDKMRSKTYANQLVHSIYLYSSINGMIVTNSNLSNRTDFFDTQWIDLFRKQAGFSQWLPTREVVFNPNSASQIHRRIITLVRAYPMNASGDSRKGVLAINVDESRLARLLLDEEQKPGKGLSSVFVINGARDVVLRGIGREDGEAWEGEGSVKGEQGGGSGKSDTGGQDGMGGAGRETDYSALAGLTDRVLESGEDGFFRTRLDPSGPKSAIYHVTSPYNGWTYIGILEKPGTSPGARVLRNVLLGSALIVLLVAAVSVMTLSRWFFRPLESFMQRLAFHAQRMPRRTSPAKETGDSLQYLEHLFGEVIRENEQMQVQIRDSRPALKWRLVTELLLGYRTDYAKERANLQMAGVELLDGGYVVMTAQMDRMEPALSPRDTRLYVYGLCNIAEELLNAEGKGAAIELDDARAVILMSFEPGDADAQLLTALSVAELIREAVGRYFRRTVTIGVGTPHPGMEEIKQSYMESQEALKYSLVMGRNTVISYEDTRPANNADMLQAYSAADKIAEHVKHLRLEAALAQLEPLFGREALPSAELVRTVCLHLLFASLTALGEAGADLTEPISSSGSLNDRLSQLETAAEMKSFVAVCLREWVETAGRTREPRERHPTVEGMMAFIRAHYGRSDMSLNLLAEEFGLSVSHLSRLFKEQVGTNFMEYLLRVRMEAAAELLKESDRKVGEVAEAVGYHNTYSFIRIFKKHTGMTPGEFRSR